MNEVMYDSVDVAQIPADAAAVAGYVDGEWPTYNELVKKFHNSQKLSIAVFASDNAECLDVEKGDATPDQAPAWVKRQLDRGVSRPAVYSDVSDMPEVLALLADAGIARGDVRVFTAHYTYIEHRCTALCGFGFKGIADATQWTDKALGRNLDQSLVADDFFGASRKSSVFLKTQTGFWSWLQWNVGEGNWKGWGRRNPVVRPNVPARISGAWLRKLAAFLRARV